MRFGQQLRSSLIKDWYYHYISYDDLKQSLKSPKPWTESDERSFVNELEQELDKVYTFQKVKSQEIKRRIDASEREVNDVIERAKQAQSNDGPQHVEAPSEDDFLLLEEDLSDIIADVHDLAKFTQLNYTGFQKIIKKHDKQTRWHLKPGFAARLKTKPFFKDNYDNAIVKLSNLYDLVRTRGNPAKGDAAAGGGQQNFVRQTTKYWVHPDNITELKLIILKHLPVLVFDPSKEFSKASAITSIYYDNTDTWELYEGRLKKTEGAEAIRLRWYGDMEAETIFVERKTHREDWTGEKSVKARFTLKEKNVNAFLAGEMTVEQAFEKMRKDKKKSEKEIADLEQLAREIQYRVISHKLVPVTRSFYNRIAFQLPGDARVRISLDTQLTMVREDNLDGRDRAGKNWRRMDIGIDFPFSQLPPEDVERFPYAVLEVKLQTQMGQEPPQWIRELTASHLVEAVPKFSKFIHGTAVLNPKRIKLLPFWLPQMDVDIRKPISYKFGIERPGQSTDLSTSGAMDDETDDEDGFSEEDDDEHDDRNNDEDENIRRLRAARDALEQHETEQRRDYPEGGANGSGAVNGDGPNALDLEERIAAQPQYLGDNPIYDSDDEYDESNTSLEEARRVGGISYYTTLIRHKARQTLSTVGGTVWRIIPTPKPTPMPQNGPTMGIPKTDVETKRFKAPKGKRIHVPVRIEPKVHLATERTFLSWLEFSLILSSIAAALLNFGDAISLYAAFGFTITSVIAILYSLCLYLWRVRMTKKRRAVSYHDIWGPTGLCVVLFASVAVSFALRLKGGKFEGGLKG